MAAGQRSRLDGIANDDGLRDSEDSMTAEPMMMGCGTAKPTEQKKEGG